MAQKYAIFGQLYQDYFYFCIVKTTIYGNTKKSLWRFIDWAQK